MSLKVKRELFDCVWSVIAMTARVGVLSWAESRDGELASSTAAIRDLPLSDDCRTTACVGGWACHLATEDEIAAAIQAYDLNEAGIDDPFTMAASLLIEGAENVETLEEACRSLFCFTFWPLETQAAYDNCRTAVERVQVVLDRMDAWAAEVEGKS